jgi:subtilisin family serine protease
LNRNRLKKNGFHMKIRRRISKKGFIFGIFLLSVLAFSTKGLTEMENDSEGLSANVMNHLLNSSKIIEAPTVLEDFVRNDSETTRVIVNLRTTEKLEARRSIEKLPSREYLANRIHDFVNNVLPGFNPAQVQKARPFRYMAGFSAQVTPEGLEALVEDADVISIEKDRLLHPNLAQGIPLMNASAARSTYGGEGLSVAICDTGIDYNHPALGNGGFPNSKVIGGYDTGDDDSDPLDLDGHGTACAGISAGNLSSDGDYIGGVAWGAKLYALKVSHGSGGSAYVSNMIEAWEWCVAHQYDDPNHPILVINTSFGGGRYPGTCDADSLAMTTAAANAKAAGMTLFVSSGNDGYCDAIGWPACISHVVSVGAVYDAHFTAESIGWCVQQQSCADKNPTWGCSTRYYSPEVPYEDQVAVYSNTAPFLSLLAPSNWATTTQLGGGYWTSAYGFGGTSAASPYAAGAAACLQSAAKAITGTFLTPDQLQTTLMNTGDSITDTKVAITKPRINLGNAVAALGGGGGSFVYVEPSRTCGGNSPCYANIQDGINAAASGDTIKISEDATAQMLSLTSAKNITLQGGWDPSFAVQTSNSTITSLSIQNGTVDVDSLVLQ